MSCHNKMSKEKKLVPDIVTLNFLVILSGSVTLMRKKSRRRRWPSPCCSSFVSGVFSLILLANLGCRSLPAQHTLARFSSFEFTNLPSVSAKGQNITTLGSLHIIREQWRTRAYCTGHLKFAKGIDSKLNLLNALYTPMMITVSRDEYIV